MNQSVKQGILIIIAILLIASLIALFNFYVTAPQGYIADSDDEVPYSKAPDDHFKDAELPLPETSSDEKSPPFSPPPVTQSSDNKSPPSSTASTERFGDDKSPTPVVSRDDNVPSSDNSPTPSVSSEQFGNNKSPSREPVVKEKNTIIKAESPDKLPPSVIERIKTFVFFVGYARSGHSIVGSLMDSHPNVVISHEYDLFTKLANGKLAPNKIDIFNALWMNTKQELIQGFRAKSSTNKGYTLFIDDLYQGQYVDHIDVIGDKKGGTTAELLAYRHEKWVQSFSILKSLNLPMKVVHVIRNPYDNIATIVLYIALAGRQKFGEFKKSNRTLKAKSSLVDRQIKFYFALHKAIVDATTTYNLDIIEIHGEDFITDSKGTLLKMCSSLGVTCYNNYLEICNNKLYKSESRTRHLLEWTEEQLQVIQENIDKYADLKQYSFHSM